MGHAARLFNGAAEQTLYSRITPTDVQREFLQLQWNSLAEHLKKTLASWGYPISTWLQGSYKYGTLIKPVHKGEEYDVDVGIYFHWEKKVGDGVPSPEQLRQWVQQELLEYQKINSDILKIDPPKERCSRAIYAQQFHIDTPTYHLDPAKDLRELACLSGKWESSDPKAIYKWFKDAVGTDNRDLLQRLVRYLKGWAAIAFQEAPSSRPSSIFLTVLATEAFQNMWKSRLFGIADDDALIAVVKSIFERLITDRRVPNPVARNEDLNRISDAAWDAFLTRLTVLHDTALAADEAEDEASAALIWAESFSFLMPLPETDAVEVIEPSSERQLMQLPEIQIQIFDPEDNLLATYLNEVPSMTKGQKLVFTIVNPQVVPDYATIEWTVRNGGGEADNIGDLGHARGGIRMLSVEEHSGYLGKHYMDCVIRNNGSLFAARRVAVYIESALALRQPKAQKNWLKLRTRRGRRR
ncbi:CBASS cGAMP synthase [Herbaspirillum seropedicae]|uniref:CBASS cGAMP synthase n=1 Tax=Herbaspirillum seropedicae TaxID=964 RepID=UPI003F8CF582